MFVPYARFRPRWIERQNAVLAIHRTLFNFAMGDASAVHVALPVSSRMILSRRRGPTNVLERRRTTGTFYGGGGIHTNTLPFRPGPSKSRWTSYSRQRTRVPRMSDCRTLEEAIEATYDHLDILSPRDVAAFWTVVPKFIEKRDKVGLANMGRHGTKGRQMRQQFETILCRTIEAIGSYGSRDLAQTTLAFAKIVKNVGVDRKNIPNDSPRQILHDLMVGTDSEDKHFIFQQVTLAANPILDEFEARHLSNLIYAFGLAGHDHESKLFKKLADHIMALDNLGAFDPQNHSNILWAYATLNETHPKLFKKVADHIAARKDLEGFKPQGLSNIVWAYAKANERHPKLFKKLADHIAAFNDLGSFKPQAFSNILWAFATLNELHPKLFKKVSDHIMELGNLEGFKPQELSNTVWAYATAKESHPKLFKKVADHIAAFNDLGSFKPQNLANILWAFATLNEPHPKLFQKVADHTMALDNLEGFNPQNLSNIAWAFATGKESHPALFQKLAEAAIQKKADFNSQEIANFLWAHASNGHLDENLFQILAPIAEASIDKCNGQGLSNIAWAFAVVNVSASSLFGDNFVKACNDKEQDFIVEGLTQLHQWQMWQEELKSHVTLHRSLCEKCGEAFVSREPRPSALQDDVVSELKGMGLQPKEEVLTKRGYRLDAVVKVDGNRIGVEVDGPSHFLGRSPTGSTMLKHRQVGNVEGIPVVSVPYWEWNKLRKDSDKKQKYLLSLLGLSQS